MSDSGNFAEEGGVGGGDLWIYTFVIPTLVEFVYRVNCLLTLDNLMSDSGNFAGEGRGTCGSRPLSFPHLLSLSIVSTVC